VREQDILPVAGGRVARLPVDAAGEVQALAVGNYANDHHYPTGDFTVQPKSIRWGGRWTGTPFTIPYGCLIPASTDGFLACEKNISVSHIANGATRLQPVVMNIGQAAGMAAALCVEMNCQPRDLPVRVLQSSLVEDSRCPAGVIPLFNLRPSHPEWLHWQRYYLLHPDAYPISGDSPCSHYESQQPETSSLFTGIFHRRAEQDYTITVDAQTWMLITLQPVVDMQLQTYADGGAIALWGRVNLSGGWLVVEKIADTIVG
jgi:hypothetical protein